MTLRFGTDGVRGAANTELTPELTLQLGRAAALALQAEEVLVGRDTRVSGPLLAAALTAGLAAEGVRVTDLGVVPTPAVAHLSAELGVPAAMISASHNPFPDNGIKLFEAGGRKLSDEREAELEGLLDGALPSPGASGAGVGRIVADSAAARAWVDHVVAAVEGRRLDGLHLVVDAAHGAASGFAGPLFERLGARVDVLHAEPDGTNINDGCGSTHPEALAAVVVERGAALGLALDGDADRVLAVDHRGAVVDGDQLMAMAAVDLHERGRLANETVVVTVMSNLGFRLAMRERGIAVEETPVGDRHVLEALERGGHSLGGEQSGHVIFRDLATTGDGLLTGLLVADLAHRTGQPLADLAAAAMTRLPQVLRNVRVAERRADVAELLADRIAEAETALGERGRVLVRPSGTEPVVRVMVEAETRAQAAEVADRLAAEVERACH